MNIGRFKFSEEVDDFFDFLSTNFEVVVVIILMILVLFFFPGLRTRYERQKCHDYAELINVEYVYKKSLGCFIRNKQNEWQFINLNKLEEQENEHR